MVSHKVDIHRATVKLARIIFLIFFKGSILLVYDGHGSRGQPSSWFKPPCPSSWSLTMTLYWHQFSTTSSWCGSQCCSRRDVKEAANLSLSLKTSHQNACAWDRVSSRAFDIIDLWLLPQQLGNFYHHQGQDQVLSSKINQWNLS